MRAVFDVPRPPWGPRSGEVGPSGAVGQFRWHPTLGQTGLVFAPPVEEDGESILTEDDIEITTEDDVTITTES